MNFKSQRRHALVILAAILWTPFVFGAQTDPASPAVSQGASQPEAQSSPYARIHRLIGQPMYLAALGDVDGGPPPCEKDGYCNINACPSDPDCPTELPEPSYDGTPEPTHDGKGGLSVWLTTGPDGAAGGHSCDLSSHVCNIKVTWSVQPDRYDMWKICWKDWGDTFTKACDENQKTLDFATSFYVIPNLQEGQHYRIHLEGRKDKNDKWKCLVKARLRNVHLNGTNIGSTVPCFIP